MLAPMLLTSRSRGWPDPARWTAEPKWDGWRLILTVAAGDATAHTRHGTDLTHRLPHLAQEATGLGRSLILDGELVRLAPGPDGPVCDFAWLMRLAAPSRRTPPCPQLHFVAWDLLALDGQDLTSQPWHARRVQLEHLLQGTRLITATPTLPATEKSFDHVVSQGMEGLVLKRRDATYRPGARSPSWIKVKGRHHVTGRVLAAPDGASDEPRALVEIRSGRRVWALSPRDLAAGDQVTIAYTRTDADGSLREARVHSRPRIAA